MKRLWINSGLGVVFLFIGVDLNVTKLFDAISV